MTNENLLHALRTAYDRAADERDGATLAGWKFAERRQFLERMQAEGCLTLLEIGAGSGAHARYFQDEGVAVTCTDLSPELVRRCRDKGLTAHVMDFLHLDFPAGCFDALFAMNCLLHVPRADLDRVLEAVSGPLKTGGLFYWGQYGGRDEEGTHEGDHYQPKRFFSRLTAQTLLAAASKRFEVVEFHTVALEETWDVYQSLTLRKPV